MINGGKSPTLSILVYITIKMKDGIAKMWKYIIAQSRTGKVKTIPSTIILFLLVKLEHDPQGSFVCSLNSRYCRPGHIIGSSCNNSYLNFGS